MLFEIVFTGSMIVVLRASYYFITIQKNDTDKIIKIADNCGLYTDDDELRLYGKNRSKDGKFTEYVFKIPFILKKTSS